VPCETCGSVPCFCADLAVAEPERPRLMPGDYMRCKKCNGWHVVETSPDATSSSRNMLWFHYSDGALFYAGTFGLWLVPEEAARWRPGPRL
jgi:hypothetical protein